MSHQLSAERALQLRLASLAGSPPLSPPIAHTSPDAQAAAHAWRQGTRPDGVVTHRIAGLQWTVPADSGGDGSLSQRLRDGWLPFERIAQVRQLTTGGVMLDIGANIGTTAIPRVLLGDVSHVYAAEPHPDNFACLVGNVLDNDLEGYVLPSRVALGSMNGTATLRVSRHLGGHALIAKSQRKDPTIDVETLTLDTWLARDAIDPRAIRFVKIDVQGWEGHVLLGASALLPARPIIWQVEISPNRIKKSGLDPGALFAEWGTVFGWCLVLDTDAGIGLRPASRIADVIARAQETGRSYVDLLLGHGTPGD